MLVVRRVFDLIFSPGADQFRAYGDFLGAQQRSLRRSVGRGHCVITLAP
jgi:hypothetical protein